MNRGNNNQLSCLQSFLLRKNPNNPSVIAITGSRFLCQSTSIKVLLSRDFHESDFMEMGSGIDGAREVVEFARTEPVGGLVKVILVDDADRLSEPAQDALLKLSESPPDSVVIVLIAYDVGLLQPALSSRIRAEIRFTPLSMDEMREYASSLVVPVSNDILVMACGLPELYKLIVETGGFEELHNSIISAAKRDLSIFSKPPKVISDLENGYSLTRDAVIHTIRCACKPYFFNKSISIPILKFCSVLSNSTSANTDVHWMRMVSDLLM